MTSKYNYLQTKISELALIENGSPEFEVFKTDLFSENPSLETFCTTVVSAESIDKPTLEGFIANWKLLALFEIWLST